MRMRTAATKVCRAPLSLLVTVLETVPQLLSVLRLTMIVEEEPRYENERDRSASPRPMKRDDNYRGGGRDRSASPNGRMDSR